MSEEQKAEQGNAQPSHAGRSFCTVGAIIVGVFIILVILGLVGWFVYVNFINNPYDYKGKTANTTPSTSNSSNNSTATTPSTGDWTLTMTSPSSMTGPETQLTGEGKSTISFKMPAKDGEKFSATGNWNSEMTGTVGAGTTKGTVSGTITIAGERKNGKLTFTPTYNPEKCMGSVMTPIGGDTVTTCDPNSNPAAHTIEINIAENAHAVKDVATNYGLYSLDWKENWTLTKI